MDDIELTKEFLDLSFDHSDEESSQAASHISQVKVNYRGSRPNSSPTPKEIVERNDPQSLRISANGLRPNSSSNNLPSDIKLRPDLITTINPPINVINFLKKNMNKTLPNIKYDEAKELLKDREVKKSVGNFDLGEQHIVTKSSQQIRSHSLKNFQVLNQFKLGISPLVKRELLQKIIVEDKLNEERKKLEKLRRSNSSPNNDNNNTGFPSPPHSPGSPSSPLSFNDETNTNFPSPDHPPSPTLEDYLIKNGKPISFLPKSSLDHSRLADGIRNKRTPAQMKKMLFSNNAANNKDINKKNDEQNNNNNKKKIIIKPKAERSFNPKAPVSTHLVALKTPPTHYPHSSGLFPESNEQPLHNNQNNNNNDMILTGRGSLSSHGTQFSDSQTLRSNTKPPVTDLKITIHQSDEKAKTPLYHANSFRRPKPVEGVASEGIAMSGGDDLSVTSKRSVRSNRSQGSSSPLNNPKSPMVHQTEKLLDKMEKQFPKAISFDEYSGHPKNLRVNTGGAGGMLNDELSTSSMELSVIAKIPKTPATPGGKARKTGGEMAEQLVRPGIAQQQQQQQKATTR
jgi:hypothetical protein